MPYTKEAILPIVEELKQLNDYEDIAAIIQSGVDFLTGQTFTAPVFTDTHDAKQMCFFISRLQLPDHWDENDRLILQLISPPVTWEACRETFLHTIVPMMDTPGTSSSIVLRFSYFTSFLQQRGCTPEEIGSMLISYSGDGNNFDLAPLKFTPLRKFLQDLIKSAEWHVIDAYIQTWNKKGWNSLFFRLLSKGHPEREMEYLENILAKSGYYKDHYELSRILLQNNLSKYEPVIEKTAGWFVNLPDYTGALTNYQLLADHLPEKYNQQVVKAAYNYLDMPNTGIPNQDLRLFEVPGDSSSWAPPAVMAIRLLLQLDKFPAINYLDNYLVEKRYVHPDVFQLLTDQLQDRAVPLLLRALENDYDAKILLPVLTQLNTALYIDQLWPYTLHKLKSVRTLVAVILAEHPMALEKAGELLLHKKADQRLTAVQILCRLNTIDAKKLLQQALHKETNDDARDLMLETLGDTITDTDDAATVAQLVSFAKKRGKLSRPLETWLDDTTLPPLYLLNGTAMTTDMMRFLLYRMSRIKEIRSDVEARPLLRLIDKSRSGDFAAHLFKIYTDKGGDAKYKYLMALAALVGDDVLADKLHIAINHWIDDKRLKMAEHGVGALAIHGSDNALRAVEFLSRKYRIRKSNVGAAALVALQHAAAEIGIGIHELGDRIVPDFGFTGLFKYFEVKGEVYGAFIDSNFKPAYFNENNRKLKSIPAATSSDIKESFKTITKEVAEVVKSQSPRLEHFLVTQRAWSAAQWQGFFLHNPVMFVYATRLLWGIYDEQGQLTGCFHCQEDTTLVNVEGEKITIPENAHVRILHPLYLDAGTLQQWKQKFVDLAIIPVFPQLERLVAALSPLHSHATLVHDFEDISLESDVLNKHMELKGWKLSEGSDSKYVYAYHKTDDEHQLEVIIEVSVIYKDDAFCYKLGKLYFIDKTKTQQQWVRSTDKDAANYLLPLQSVPPVFYSEAMTDIAISRDKVVLV
ncbi:uncharacterized protein DUF4132 [Chitinophaga niastensis]|uniref:Uncharacterized protein DUF4132 n=1 Tax=Chitinophaga niastensis TaxID=536980 RepID=A0A2P8HH19_CHINA|nr:DUF4132 domain-containing protein [Chitinophaga niastensis]PSL45511.1 uncharacterized protein DUF4132 [Chitinophaga niastensis]